MARSKGTGKRFIVGFKDGGTYQIKRQTWVPIQARLKLKRSLPIGVQEEIIGATRSYVLEVRSQVSETSGNLLEVLHKWLDDTRTLRNQIWMQKQSTTEETGAVGLLRLKDVYALDESGVLRSGLNKIGGVACCRFHGRRDKVLLLKPESMNAKTEVQPRVQA